MFKFYFSRMSKIVGRAVCLLMVFALLFGILPTSVNVLANEMEMEVSSLNAPEGYEPKSAQIFNLFRGLRLMADDPMPSILLIEDVSPWGATQHHALLQSIGNVEKVQSNNVSSLDLNRFDLIVMSNDQPSSTYNNYANFKSALELYILLGGTVLLGACDEGWNGGYINYDLPAGLKKLHNYDPRNYIVDYQHPIVTGELTSSSALTNNDLYGNYCSHSSFDETTIPDGGRVILRDSYGQPTLVEYPYGTGTVIANGLTWEHNLEYGGSFSPVALRDLFTYTSHIASDTFSIEISSAIVDIVNLDDYIDITVSTKGNPGVAGMDIEFEFDNRGGHLEPVSIMASGGIDGIYSNIDDSSIDWMQNNKITVVWATPENLPDDTDLFTIRFSVSDSMEYNEAYYLNLSGMAVNELYEELDFNVKTGSIMAIFIEDMGESMYGDVHMDINVDIKDPVRLVQYLVDMVELSRYERIAANTKWDNSDEAGKPGLKDDGALIQINIKDAIRLGEYLAGHEGAVLGSMD